MTTSAFVVGSEPVNVERFDDRWLADLMSWFPDAHSCRSWAGPQFRFPFDDATFREDLKVDHLTSLGLTSAEGGLLAFGQYYLRLGRCHLARLVVAPALRGRGMGGILVHALCDRGREKLGTESFSLFVLAGNASARQLYRRLGFSESPYPEPASMLEGSLYMVATLDQLTRSRTGRHTP
jgi:ribosomal protein S18 acetylase RimI-like enzyme